MHCSLSADGHANGGGHTNGVQIGKKTKKSVNKKCRVLWCIFQNIHNMLIIFVQCIIASMPMGTQMWENKNKHKVSSIVVYL